MTSKNASIQKWILVMLLALGGGTIFKAMYLREVFYYPWNTFMGVNNTESGLLMGWLGLVGIISGAIAGPIIDKINNTRYILCFAFVAMGLTCFWQATAPALSVQYLIITILSFLGNGLFLIGMIRATRLIGKKDDQGKLFGFLESGRGVAGSIVSAVAVFAFSLAANEAAGISALLNGYGWLYICLGALFWFVLPKNAGTSDELEKGKKISLHDVLAVLKIKEVWMASISIFSTICFYQGSSYLVPYLTDAYGMSVDTASIIGMIRAYVLAVFLAPVAGILVDKVGSAIKVMNWCFILGAMGVAGFLVVPRQPEMVFILIGLLMCVGSINFALRGIMYAQVEEMKVPARLTGTVMGILATIGFSPEVFIHALFGWWLDAYKMDSYNYMFIFMCGAFILGAICTFMLFKRAPAAFNNFDTAKYDDIQTRS